MVITAPRASSIIYNFLKSNSRGGYFVLPVNICPIVPLVFMKAGVEFKFVDVNEDSLCLDYESLVEHIANQNCEGVVFVYTYGIKVKQESLFNTIKKRRSDFTIIEDKCLSIPSFSLSKASVHATLTLYSTGYAKFCEFGYGGFALCHRPIEYKIHACEYIEEDFEAITSSYKNSLENYEYFKFDKSLNWLENSECKWSLEEYRILVYAEIAAITPIKAELNAFYAESIPKTAWLLKNYTRCSDWRFQIRVEQRDKLLQSLFNHSLFASAHYQCLDGIFSEKRIAAKNARRMQGEILNLFNDRHFSEGQVRALCMLINEHLSKLD